MPIRCPYCSHEMAPKGVGRGSSIPRCPECQEKFQLLVPDDPSIPPSVNKAADASHETLTPAVAHVLGIEGAVTQRIPQTPVAPVAPPPPAPSQMQTVKPQAAVGLASPAQDVPASVGETQAIPDERPLAGRLGGYDVLQKLGQGGMGAVYLARQISLDRNVALKVLAPSLASDPQFVARFTREAYAAAQLTHHNVVADPRHRRRARRALLQHGVRRGPDAGRARRRARASSTPKSGGRATCCRPRAG